MKNKLFPVADIEKEDYVYIREYYRIKPMSDIRVGMCILLGVSLVLSFLLWLVEGVTVGDKIILSLFTWTSCLVTLMVFIYYWYSKKEKVAFLIAWLSFHTLICFLCSVFLFLVYLQSTNLFYTVVIMISILTPPLIILFYRLRYKRFVRDLHPKKHSKISIFVIGLVGYMIASIVANSFESIMSALAVMVIINILLYANCSSLICFFQYDNVDRIENSLL